MFNSELQLSDWSLINSYVLIYDVRELEQKEKHICELKKSRNDFLAKKILTSFISLVSMILHMKSNITYIGAFSSENAWTKNVIALQ